MKKPMPPADLWEQLSIVENEVLIVRPPGSFTTSEYAKKREINWNTAVHALERLESLGKLVKHKVSNRVYWTIR